jgi:hypothetical protein
MLPQLESGLLKTSPETMARLHDIKRGCEFVRNAFRDYMESVGYEPESVINQDG